MSEAITVRGQAKYAKLFENNRDRGSKAGENGAKYDYPESTQLNLVVDQENLGIITKANPKLKPNVGEEGIEVRFKRNWINPVPSRGGMAKIIDAEGNDWDQQVLIGNGSEVEVVAEVYETKFGKSMRLLGVRVLDLVEYVPEADEPENVPDWLK